MRKFIALLSIFIIFNSTLSYAVIIPVPSPAFVGSVLLHAAVVTAVKYFGKPNSTGPTTSLNTSGDAIRPTQAVWIELTGLVPTIKTADIITTVKYNDLTQMVSSSISTPLQSVFYNSLQPNTSTGAGQIMQDPISLLYYTASGSAYIESTSFNACQPETTAHNNYTRWQEPFPSGNGCYVYRIDHLTTPLSSAPPLSPKTGTASASSYNNPTTAQSDQLAGIVEAPDAPVKFLNTNLTDYIPSPNAISDAQQLLSDVAAYRLDAYNAAVINYLATPTTANFNLLNGVRADYNDAVRSLNTSLASTSATTGVQALSPNSNTPVDPSSVGAPLSSIAPIYGGTGSSSGTSTGMGGTGGTFVGGTGGPPATGTNPTSGTTPTTGNVTGTSTSTAPVFGSYSGGGNFNVGSRFKTFFDQMKTTSVFSLPTQFAAGIPAGGSSTMSFNGGRFGQQTFDFSTFSGLFIVVKSIFLVICSWVALKIVTKGGA